MKTDYGDLSEVETAIAKTVDKLDSPGVLAALKDSLNYRGMVMAGIVRTLASSVLLGKGFSDKDTKELASAKASPKAK